MSTTDTQTPGTLVKGNVISAGDITVEDIQRAIAEGLVKFTMFD
jgi:hypothetical protein